MILPEFLRPAFLLKEEGFEFRFLFAGPFMAATLNGFSKFSVDGQIAPN
jgi:hypothetical protein